MKTTFVRFLSIVMVATLTMMYSCGSSSESQREQEINDSIKLEQERRELIDRANKVLEKAEKDSTDTESDTPDQ